MVLLPYNILLHKPTREVRGEIGSKIQSCVRFIILSRATLQAFQLLVKDNIVIVDEAHNLIDSIAQAYSVSLSLDLLRAALGQLSRYKVRPSFLLGEKLWICY